MKSSYAITLQSNQVSNQETTIQVMLCFMFPDSDTGLSLTLLRKQAHILNREARQQKLQITSDRQVELQPSEDGLQRNYL